MSSPIATRKKRPELGSRRGSRYDGAPHLSDVIHVLASLGLEWQNGRDERGISTLVGVVVDDFFFGLSCLN